MVLVVLHDGQLRQAEALPGAARGEAVRLDQAEVVVEEHALRHGRARAAGHVDLHGQRELVGQLRQGLAHAALAHRSARHLEHALVLQRARAEEGEVVDVGEVVRAADGLAVAVDVEGRTVDEGPDGMRVSGWWRCVPGLEKK